MKPQVCFVALATSVCCTTAAAGGSATMPIYDATQVALGSFVVVERITIGGWRSAFGVPAYSTHDAARDAVLARASQVGADAVVNLTCMSQTDRVLKRAGYLCYANAIKARSDGRL